MRDRGFIGVVMAAGAGRRLAGMYRPKVLAPVANRRLIDHSIETLRLAGATRVAAVVADDRTADYASTWCDLIRIEPESNVLYGIMRSIAAYPNDDRFVWLDGDTVAHVLTLASAIAGLTVLASEADAPAQLSGEIVLSGASNHGSQWTILTDDGRWLSGVECTTSVRARLVVALRREAVVRALDRLGGETAVRERRDQHCAFPGYERYFCGWGLLFALLSDIGVRVGVKEIACGFLNVNTPNDLVAAQSGK